MGVSGIKKLIIAIIILAAAGTAALYLTRSHAHKGLSREDYRFADVFIEMAVAREMAGNNLDSLDVLYAGIFKRYDTDSLWLFDYISKMSYDSEKNKIIWDMIMEKLDSLKGIPDSDSAEATSPGPE